MLLTMMATTGTMWGQTSSDFEFNLNQLYQNGTLVTAKTVITTNGGTLTFTDENENFTILMTRNSGNQPGFYTSSGYIRFYGTDTFKLSAANGITITKIVVTPNGSSFSVSAMDGLTTSTKTWEGSASEVTFTGAGTNKWDKLTITYTTSGGGDTPSLSVTPSALDFGSKAINPNEPYTETFTVTYANLTENLTVSVGEGLTGISVSPQEISKDGDGSQVVTVSYNPTSAGEISGNITISNTEDELSKTVAVSGSSYDPTSVVIYERYTGDIVEGDYIICANEEVAMKNVISSNRFANESVTVADNKITNPDASIIWHIAADGDHWIIYNAAADKYAGGTTSNNQGALLDEITDYSRWDITYAYSNYTVICYGRNASSNKYLRRNGTYGWATYGNSTGNPPTFYKKAGATTYSVTYNANGATAGTVPVDETQYDSDNNTVTVLGNTGNLAKAGYIWSGWNTQTDGEGTAYQADDTFEITASTTLYAMWTPKAITGLAYTGTPTATQYDGQAFNPAGLTVTATFNDESQEDVTSDVVWTPNPLTIETTSVTGTYMEQTVVVEGITVTYAPGTENNPYTVAQAIEATPASGTSANVYIHGIVSAFYGTSTSIMGDGSNYRYYISDDGTTTSQLLVYKGKGLNNVAFSSADDLHIGDIVTIYGGLTTYQNASEIASGNYLTSLERPAVDVEAPTFSVAAGGYAETQTVEITCATDGAQIYYTNDGSDPTNESFLYDEEIDIEETTTIKAIAYVGENASAVSSAAYYILSDDNNYTVTQALNFAEYPQNNVFVHGIVSTAPTSLLDGGLLTYYISVDGTENNRLQVYKGKNLDNAVFNAVDDIQVGDAVTIFGNVKLYNSQKEFDQGNYLVTWERLETVATPTFTPEEGEYAEAQSVRIACATEGATIYYKTAENAEWAVYSEAINVDETTTIWAYAAKDGMNNSAVATATYTINTPVLTASITVEPALVEATAEGGDGTLTVTYENITDVAAEVYFCDENGDAATYGDWIQAEIDDNNNVYYIIGANDGEARTAYLKVYALDGDAEDVYSNLVTVNQAAYVAPSQEVTDVLNLAFTGVSGTSYDNWSDKTGTSGAVYAGNSAGGNDAIQLRSNSSNSGIVSTTSGGKITKVVVTWNSNTNNDRTLNVYGSNTAYTSPTELYGSNIVGELIGTIVKGTSTELTITDEYAYIGLRSASGAMYLDEIDITWSTGPAAPSITVAPTEINIDADEHIEELSVAVANISSIDVDSFSVDYCNLDGSEIEGDKPNIIDDYEFTANQQDEGYTLTITFNANTGEARTAYFKVIYELGENDNVHSNVITVNQEAYVAPVASITIAPAEVADVPAAGDVPEHTVTIANMTISSTDEFEFVYCDAEGNILGNEDPKPNWIELADAEYSSTGENTYSMVYTIAANEETTPRTGYFKISVEQATDIVYSNLVTVTQNAAPVVADNYVLFTGELEEGDYIIYYDGYAMKNIVSNNRLGYETVTPTNDTISTSDASIVWHIAPSATESYWTIYNAAVNAYAASTSSNNQAQLLDNGTDNMALWEDSKYDNTYDFVNKSNSRLLRNNGTYGFACYSSSTGGSLSLYQKVDYSPSIDLGGDQNIGNHNGTGLVTWEYIDVKQKNLTKDITLTASIGELSTYNIAAGAGTTEVLWTHTFNETGDFDVTITATSGETQTSIHLTGTVRQTYYLYTNIAEHGSIDTYGETALQGDYILFTLIPDEGYMPDVVTVMAGGTPVECSARPHQINQFEFDMPDSDVTISATFKEAVYEQYELFSGDLVEGDYMIVYDNVAMFSYENTEYGLQYKTVAPENDIITTDDAAMVWHLAPSTTEGYWTIHNEARDLYVEIYRFQENHIHLGVEPTGPDDMGLWEVTGTETYEFINKQNVEDEFDANLRYNENVGFSCYSTSVGGALSLYKKVDLTPSISLGGNQNIGTTHGTGQAVSTDFTVTQSNLTENITLTASIGALSTYSIEAGADPTEVIWTHTYAESGDIDVTITATSGETQTSIHITGEVKQSHLITIADVENGAIAIVGDKTTEIQGQNVDFTVTPDEGYVIDEITVMAGETPVEYTPGDSFYRFQMPDSDVTISATFTIPATEYYELFSGELVEGDYIVYYNGYALKNEELNTSGRLSYEVVTPENDVISTADATIIWHIAPSSEYWTMYSADANKYAAGTGVKNKAQMLEDGTDDKAMWTVSGNETYEFINKANSAANVNCNLRNNGTNGWACYATSTGGALSLYKKVDNTPSLSFNGPTANIGTYAVGEEIVWDNITVTQHNLTESISLSAKKGTVNPTSIDAGAEPTQVAWSYTPVAAGYTTDTITASSGTLRDTLIIQFMAKTPHNIYTSVENGIIVVLDNKTTAIENENVDFTVTPDEGYELNEITVMAGETPVEYMIDETFYRFQMPDSDVTISATFNELPKYTVTFTVNNHPDGELIITQGNSTPLPTTSEWTPTGFAISGWALEGSTIAVADPYEPTADVDLYALLQLENAQTASGDYVKVTEELPDWSGEYLIVYENDSLAFDGSLTTLDAVGDTIKVTLTNNTIEAISKTNASKFTIVAVDGGYSIQSASGYFIGQTSDKNGLATSTTTVYTNTISYDTENHCVDVTSSGAYLRYNAASNQSRFRYYKSDSYTNQQAIQLYKKGAASFNTVIVLNNTEPEQTWNEPIPDSTCVVVPENVILTYTGPNPSVPEALVIQEGGQLILESDVDATVQIGVSGYGSKSGSGWYLISSPVAGLSTSAVATGTYDLFAYDEATAYWWVDHAIPGQTANHTFDTLSRGKGYLYANSTDVNLNYAGTMKATNTNIKVDLSYACDDYPDLKGFNLVGNPFTRNLVYGDMIIGGEVATSYLILNNDEEYEECNLLNGDEIKPGQGFFIQATATDQQLEFNPSSKDMSAIGLISIKAGDENYTDKAYIQFGGGNTLRKMTFGENTLVYVMNDDLDYATARVDELAGTMPVHFDPVEDGFYTITVETKNIENLNYMHLIDNITNTDIDLLAEPSYTFKASESDNTDRFYLVFDFNNYTGVNENYTNGNFAHQIGDEIFVSGEGTLQVFDVLGRFVTGYNVNGDKRISTAAFNTGVYIFRMVGTEVKTQKIVIR